MKEEKEKIRKENSYDFMNILKSKNLKTKILFRLANGSYTKIQDEIEKIVELFHRYIEQEEMNVEENEKEHRNQLKNNKSLFSDITNKYSQSSIM